MDAAHEAELARIMSRRKQGNRTLGGPTADNNADRNSPPPALVQQPAATGAAGRAGAAVAPAAAAPNKQQQIAHGDIVVERQDPASGAISQQPIRGAAPRDQDRKIPSSAAFGSASGSGSGSGSAAAVPQNSVPLQSNADLSRILDELQRQGRAQQQQMRHLQESVDDMSNKQQVVLRNTSPERAAPASSAAGAGSRSVPVAAASSSSATSGGGGNVPPPPANLLGSKPGRPIGGSGNSNAAPGPRTASGANDQDQDQDQQSYKNSNTYMGATDTYRAMREEGLIGAEPNPAHQKVLSDAAAMGLFVKPRSVVSHHGSRMVTFNSPSRNEIGTQPTPNKNVFGRSSPSRQQHGGGGGNARSIPPPPNRMSQQTSRGAPRGGGGGELEDDGELQQQNGPMVPAPNQSPMNIPRPAKQQPVPKPFSYSTFDVDSARVLLATGDWLYKLRVHINPNSITGPAGWDILNCVPRYVYLDTTTYILKWGDRPGGSATIVSHYVPIDHIVNVEIFSSTEARQVGGNVVVYYLVCHICEGGYYARNRAVPRRLAVFATELRDKADMWFEALKTISGFYKAKSAATALTTKTFSSD